MPPVDTSVQHADYRKLDLVIKALEIYATPLNRYTVDIVRKERGSQDKWQTILVTPRRAPLAQYQLLDPEQWIGIHKTGNVLELAAIIERLVQDINSRGW